MSKRHEEEEHEGGSERWLLTYSDMITLLLALFIMLYTISSVDSGKYQALSNNLGIAFNGSGGSSIVPGSYAGGVSGSIGNVNIDLGVLDPTRSPAPGVGGVAGKEYTQEDIENMVGSLIQSNGLDSMASVKREERGVVVSFQDALLFSSGSAEINSKSTELLKKLAVITNSVKNYIRVEGSTDNVPISNGNFNSNWELASQRAINVAKMMISFGVDPSRVSATSYGEYRPVAPNDSTENKKLNRRVDIVFVNIQYNVNEPGYEDKK